MLPYKLKTVDPERAGGEPWQPHGYLDYVEGSMEIYDYNIITCCQRSSLHHRRRMRSPWCKVFSGTKVRPIKFAMTAR